MPEGVMSVTELKERFSGGMECREEPKLGEDGIRLGGGVFENGEREGVRSELCIGFSTSPSPSTRPLV